MKLTNEGVVIDDAYLVDLVHRNPELKQPLVEMLRTMFKTYEVFQKTKLSKKVHEPHLHQNDTMINVEAREVPRV